MPLAAALGAKAPGQLIRSEDWNALVAGVNAIESALGARISTLESTVSALDARLGTVETGITGLRTDVDDILAATYRVTLETSTSNYALGELAQLTATVRDARGQIPTPVNGERPWVDFVTTWGQLKAESGFASRAGVAGKSLSVQTNAQGVARVRLSSELVHDMTDDLELEFNGFLQTLVGAQNQTFAQIMLASNTPSDAQVVNAYKTVQLSYDSAQGGAVRDYVDSYYIQNSPKLSGKVSANIASQWKQRWRDHHVTVLAFGKTDSDPRTPDAARGTNAIQVTFRDWIGPWMIIDYLPSHVQHIPLFTNGLQSSLTLNYTESANLMKNFVQERVQNLGLLGKTRAYEAMRGAIDGVNPALTPDFLPQLKQSMKSAVSLQQSFLQAQVSTPSAATDEVALQAFTGTAVRADSQVAGVDAQIKQFQQQVAQAQTAIQQQVTSVQQTVTALGGRLDATAGAGGQMEQMRANLNTVNAQVQSLQKLGDPSQVTERLNIITALDNRLTRIERGG